MARCLKKATLLDPRIAARCGKHHRVVPCQNAPRPICSAPHLQTQTQTAWTLCVSEEFFRVCSEMSVGVMWNQATGGSRERHGAGNSAMLRCLTFVRSIRYRQGQLAKTVKIARILSCNGSLSPSALRLQARGPPRGRSAVVPWKVVNHSKTFCCWKLLFRLQALIEEHIRRRK